MIEKLPEGIILVDKPKHITSFDVIRILRKRLKIRKMGHAGTLDPLATGLLIIGVGGATKLLTNYIKLEKTYEAEILIGTQTDTGDVDGKVIKKCVIPKLSETDIRKVLSALIGENILSVPMYSAIKIDGIKLYSRARKGDVSVVPPEKSMKILLASLIKMEPVDDGLVISVRLDVSSGTYVRSIAEEIGRRLHTCATIQNLRRTRIGTLTVENAVSPEKVG